MSSPHLSSVPVRKFSIIIALCNQLQKQFCPPQMQVQGNALLFLDMEDQRILLPSLGGGPHLAAESVPFQADIST